MNEDDTVEKTPNLGFLFAAVAIAVLPIVIEAGMGAPARTPASPAGVHADGTEDDAKARRDRNSHHRSSGTMSQNIPVFMNGP